MKKYIRKHISAGVYIDDKGKLKINITKDKMHRDLILFNQNNSGKLWVGDVPVIYAYQYNPDCENKDYVKFRKLIKHPQNVENLDDFVERGVLYMDRFAPLDGFDTIIRIRPTSKPSILDNILVCLLEHVSPHSISLELIKQTYDHVSFNADQAIQDMIAAGFDEEYAYDRVGEMNQLFEKLKGSGKLFQMKNFTPRPIRANFSNYLKFETEKEARVYKDLQGANVLIYDDLLTSGATLKEASKYLTAINPMNSLTCFVLIQQNQK